jgi:drug/metabolite transporter (DMT)-like permease
MPLDVVAVVLVAAILHASWNALLKPVDERLEVFALGGALLGLPLAAAAPFLVPAGDALPFVAASIVAHLVYNLLFTRSYAVGEFNQVYPLARGLSPLLVAVVAVVAISERPAGGQLAGIVVISLGLAMLAGRPRTHERLAIALALVTGVMIAAYSVIDGIGVREADDVLAYSVWLFAGETMLTAGYVGRRMRVALARWRRAILVAGLSLAAYGTVIWAQLHAALGGVAALRETSVIVAALIGALVFGERFGIRRVIASVIVAVGVALLSA